MAKTIPIKRSGVNTDSSTLAIGTTQISITPLPTETSGYMVLDYNSSSLAEEVSFSHSGSNPVTISATTKQHTGGFAWLIDNTNGYYQELAKIATNDGWINPNEAWSYASATTITVPAGAASRYAVGDKIKLTQSTVKYFYVVAVADTTLTINGGTDYTLTNAAISLNYYSKSASPIGFPQWFNWTPTLSVASGTAPTYTGTFKNRFSINGRTLTALFTWINASGGTAGSGSNALNATLPVAMSASGFNAAYQTTIGSAMYLETGACQIVLPTGGADATQMSFHKADNSSITGADQDQASRYIQGQCSYEI